MTHEIVNTICSALSGLNHDGESRSQGVALGWHVNGPLGRITKASGLT